MNKQNKIRIVFNKLTTEENNLCEKKICNYEEVSDSEEIKLCLPCKICLKLSKKYNERQTN